MQGALNSRVAIEQAKGALAERGNIGTDEAFSRLRRYARDHNLKLTDLATAVVARTLPAAVLAELVRPDEKARPATEPRRCGGIVARPASGFPSPGAGVSSRCRRCRWLRPSGRASRSCSGPMVASRIRTSHDPEVAVGQAQERWLRMTTALAVREGADTDAGGLCTACAEVLAADAAGIVLMGEDALPAATYASNGRAAALEDLQFTLGVGPGPDAYRSGNVSSTRATWPVGLRPVGSVSPVRLSSRGYGPYLPIHSKSGAARIGTLTLYHVQPGPLSSDDYADALVMADVVTLALLAMQSGMPEGALADELTDGAYRAEIHQASGMISVQLDVDVGEALVRLRARAAAENTSVALLAADVVARRIRFER